MEVGPLSNDVSLLLRDRVESFEQLETLLLLAQHPDENWAPELVGKKLNVAATIAGEALDELCGRSLLMRVGGEAPLFRYSPGTPEIDAAVKALARTYVERRIEVMRVLNTNAVERVRTSAMRLFADAFLIRRRTKDG